MDDENKEMPEVEEDYYNEAINRKFKRLRDAYYENCKKPLFATEPPTMDELHTKRVEQDIIKTFETCVETYYLELDVPRVYTDSISPQLILSIKKSTNPKIQALLPYLNFFKINACGDRCIAIKVSEEFYTMFYEMFTFVSQALFGGGDVIEPGIAKIVMYYLYLEDRIDSLLFDQIKI